MNTTRSPYYHHNDRDIFDRKPVKSVFKFMEWMMAPKRFKAIFITITAIIVLGIIAGIGLNFVQSAGNEATHSNCVVNSKDRTRDAEGKSEMRVYTDNCGTFTVTDNLLKGFWNSADVYGQIKEGNTYDFKTTGVRNGFASIFPNIYEATSVR